MFTSAKVSPNSSDWTAFEQPDWGEWAIVKVRERERERERAREREPERERETDRETEPESSPAPPTTADEKL